MKKSNKLSKEDKVSALIAVLFVVVFLLLVLVGIKSRQVQRLDHYVACSNICFPKRIDADRSKVFCHCIENEENATQ